MLSDDDRFDIASYASASAGAIVDLDTTTQDTRGAGNDTPDSIEGVIGSDFRAILIGHSVLEDVLEGGGGDDRLSGPTGNNTVSKLTLHQPLLSS